jgi:hypothetical protein
LFRVKCQDCSGYTLTATLEGARCSVCGRVLVAKTQVASLPAQPKKIPFSPGWRFVATVTPHPVYGRALITSRPARFWSFEVASPTPARLPYQQSISFEVVRRVGDSLVVRPIDPPPTASTKGPPGGFKIDPSRVSSVTALNFPEPGTSNLELLAANDGLKAIERIGHLVFRKDDPAAWWELALGHRAVSIRTPVEGAIKQVGIERIERMMRQNVVEWDPALMDFIDEELRKIKARGPGSPATLPGNRSGWDKPWWADD